MSSLIQPLVVNIEVLRYDSIRCSESNQMQ